MPLLIGRPDSGHVRRQWRQGHMATGRRWFPLVTAADTTAVLLSRTSKNYRRQFYRRPYQFVVGMAASGRARAWPLDQLLKRPVVNDTFDGAPLVVAFDSASRTAFLYDRRLQGQPLHLTERRKMMVDRESGSTWDPRTGRATEGPNRGKQLKPIPGIISFRRAWTVFHPKSTFYTAPNDEEPIRDPGM